MKILFYTYPVAFVTPGGGELQLLETRKALQKKGITVDLFDSWQPNIHEYDLIHLFSVQSGVRHLQILAQQQGIKTVNSPIIWLRHGAALYDMQNLYQVMANSDAVLPNSEAEKQAFLDFYDIPASRFHVTHNGIDPTVYTPSSGDLFCEKFGFKKNNYILCVGNIEHRKNQIRLIQAANQLDMPLVLIGHVRDQHYFAECKKIMKNHIHYVGAFEHHSDLLKSAYAGCRFHILPSLLETPGLVSLEAATQGATLVSTNEGCAEEYFGDAAIYCDPLSVDSILKAMQAALNRHDKSINEKCRQRVLTQFSWDKTAEQTLVAYEQVLCKKESYV